MLVTVLSIPTKADKHGEAIEITKWFVDYVNREYDYCHKCTALQHYTGPYFCISFVLHFAGFDDFEKYVANMTPEHRQKNAEAAEYFNFDAEEIHHYLEIE